jgi:hypothetical protein
MSAQYPTIVKRGVIRDPKPKTATMKTRELVLKDVKEENPGMYWAEKNAAKSTIINKAHAELDRRYKKGEIIQNLEGMKGNGPYIHYPKQKDLPRGALVMGRNSGGPIDMGEMMVDIEASNRLYNSKPAHIVAIYQPTARPWKAMEYYQVEDLDKVFHGRAVPKEEREVEAARYGIDFKSDGPIPMMKYVRKGSKEWRELDLNDESRLKRDMMNRGLTVLPGGKYGGLFTARATPEFDPESGAKLSHAPWVVGKFANSKTNIWNLQGLARATKGDQKKLVVPVFIKTGDRKDSVKIRYLGFERIGANPGNHPRVLARLKQARIDYKPNWWQSGPLQKGSVGYDESLASQTKNQWFAGPPDSHIPMEKRGEWSGYWTAGAQRREFAGKQLTRQFKGRRMK